MFYLKLSKKKKKLVLPTKRKSKEKLFGWSWKI